MKIAVFSDTHRNNPVIEHAVSKMGKVDAIFHLGDNADDVEVISLLADMPVVAVRGNCDFTRNSVPLEQIQHLDNQRIWMVHGHVFEVKRGMDKLVQEAKQNSADIVLFGHTHVPKIKRERGILFLNPGSAGNAVGRPNSFAILSLENGQASAEIIEI